MDHEIEDFEGLIFDSEAREIAAQKGKPRAFIVRQVKKATSRVKKIGKKIRDGVKRFFRRF